MMDLVIGRKHFEHYRSEVHHEAIAKLAAKNSGQSIAAALNCQHEEETRRC